MPDIKMIADKADIIVNGYAFTSTTISRWWVTICISRHSVWLSACTSMPVIVNSPRVVQPSSL